MADDRTLAQQAGSPAHQRWQAQRQRAEQALRELASNAPPAVRELIAGLDDGRLAEQARAALASVLEHRPAPLHGAVAYQELGARVRERLDRLAADPPAYLRRALDPPHAHADPTFLTRWLAAAEAVERYRLLFGVTDPQHPFGNPPTPTSPWQHQELVGCAGRLAAARARQAELAADRARVRALAEEWRAAHPGIPTQRAGDVGALAEPLRRALVRARAARPAEVRGSPLLDAEFQRLWIDRVLADRPPPARDPAARTALADLLTAEERAQLALLTSALDRWVDADPQCLPPLAWGVRDAAVTAPTGVLRRFLTVEVLGQLVAATGAATPQAAVDQATPTRLPEAVTLACADARAVVAVLLDRDERALGVLVQDPPAFLLAALGRPDPDEPEWVDATRAVAAYRRRGGVTDPVHPLGPQPDDPALRAAWRAASHHVQRAVADRLGPAALPTRGDPRVTLSAVLPTPARQRVTAALTALDPGPGHGLDAPAVRRGSERLPNLELLERVEEALAQQPPAARPLQPGAQAARHRGLAAARELERRERAALDALAASPPGHVLAALGPWPAHAAQQEAWRRGALRITRYRLDHAVTDPARPLGPAPADPQERQAFERAAADLRSLATTIAQLERDAGAREPPAPEAPDARDPDLGLEP